MKAFQYATALSLESARELVGEEGRYLAGGQDLLSEMKEYIAEPKILVNVKSLPGLNKIETRRDVWTIGTNVTISQIEEHEGIAKTFPGLQQAAAEVGSKQIRNVGTVGGNLAQHSRCWYYRQRDVPCAKKGGDMCYARHGVNKYHSLFTGNPCISPVVSNLAIAFGALDASVTVQRGGKETKMSIAELYEKAWDSTTAHNSLKPGDLILKVEVPVQGRRSAYLQLSEKSQFDWALVSCAAAGKMDGKKISKARIVLGAVSPVPYEVAPANEWLEGKTLDEATCDKVSEMIFAKAKIFEHNGYKVPMGRALVRRTLMKLIV
jgi:xanthine dehydrogenase YagS FAD-binding subunit